METARKTISSAVEAGTAVIEKARELPNRLHLKLEIPQQIRELPQQIGSIPSKVGEFVTLPQSVKVAGFDIREIPATLQTYAAKGTERAMLLVEETRETAKKAGGMLKNLNVHVALPGRNGNGKATAKPAAKKTTKPRTAKKATVQSNA